MFKLFHFQYFLNSKQRQRSKNGVNNASTESTRDTSADYLQPGRITTIITIRSIVT